MRVVVTGGCGFIGSHLVEHLLNEGHEVVVLDNMCGGSPENLSDIPEENRTRLEIVECDISTPGNWEEHFQGTDWVVHLAALINIVDSLNEPREYFKTNCEGTLNVLEASRRAAIKRFAYVNSGACYGIADTYPTTEEAAKRPQYPYALTKLMGEEMVMHWAQVYEFPAVALRLFNLYGPRCSALFGLFMSQLAQGEALTITGDGSQTRDFTYITDAVEGIVAGLRSNHSGEIFNIGSGTTVSVRKVAELLGGEINYIPRRKGEMDVTYGDISKAARDLNWQPRVSIEEGIGQMLEYARRTSD